VTKTLDKAQPIDYTKYDDYISAKLAIAS